MFLDRVEGSQRGSVQTRSPSLTRSCWPSPEVPGDGGHVPLTRTLVEKCRWLSLYRLTLVGLPTFQLFVCLCGVSKATAFSHPSGET